MTTWNHMDLSTKVTLHAQNMLELARELSDPLDDYELLPKVAEGQNPATLEGGWMALAQECRGMIDACHFEEEVAVMDGDQQMTNWQMAFTAGMLLSLCLQALGWEQPYKGVN